MVNNLICNKVMFGEEIKHPPPHPSDIGNIDLEKKKQYGER